MVGYRIVALAVLLTATLAVPARKASAAALEPSKPSQIITLIAFNLNGTACPVTGMAFDRRLLPDGSVQPFAIPPKQVLVITEVSWAAAAGVAGRATGFGLSAQVAGSQGAVPFLFDLAVTDSVGIAGRTALVSNAIVPAGSSLCLTLAGSAGGNVTVNVRGFLTKDR